MKKKNGFTLVELLAVIVILAVVMLIGVTVIGPIMARSQKGALGTEGLDIINAAQLAFQTEQLSGGNIKNNSNVCFDLEWLKKHNYYSKGSDEGYTGSVLATYDTNTGSYDYAFWIGNETYMYENEKKNTYNLENAKDFSSGTTLNNCGGSSIVGLVKCIGDADCTA